MGYEAEYTPLTEEQVKDLIKALEYGDANGKGFQKILDEWADSNFRQLNEMLDEAIDKIDGLEFQIDELECELADCDCD